MNKKGKKKTKEVKKICFVNYFVYSWFVRAK